MRPLPPRDEPPAAVTRDEPKVTDLPVRKTEPPEPPPPELSPFAVTPFCPLEVTVPALDIVAPNMPMTPPPIPPAPAEAKHVWLPPPPPEPSVIWNADP